MDAIVEGLVDTRHQRDQKNLQLTRARIVSGLLIIAIVIIVAVLLNMFVLSAAKISRPIAPSSVNAIRNQWSYDILLPTLKPNCLDYSANGTGIKDDPSAANGISLQVRLTAVASAECADASSSTIVISEAPTFESLSGSVSTVIQGRMQFARIAKPAAGGQSEVTLQWHCLNIMCRMRGTTSNAITETVLTKMADSFHVIKPSS